MTAVILLAHGSPDHRAASATHALAAALEGRTFGRTARAAFLQHDEPDLTAVAHALERDGASRAVVVPALLSHAFHARVDVPAAVEAAEEATGLTLTLTEAIGPDARLLPALDRLLPPGPVVLASAGTTDLPAQRALERLGQTWALRRGAGIAVAYASQAGPDVETALAQLEASEGPASVASFVLFPGVLPDRIRAAAGDRVVTPPLASTPEVLEVVESRIAAARRAVA